MAGPCAQGFRPEPMDKNKVLSPIARLYDIADNNPVMERMIFGGGRNAVDNWVLDNFGVHPGLNPDRLTQGIADMALAEAQVQMDAMKRGMNGLFSESTKKNILPKLVAKIFLPQEVIEANIVGGDKVFLETMAIAQQSEGVTKRFQERLRTITSSIDEILDYSLSRASADLGKVEKLIEKAEEAGDSTKAEELRNIRKRMVSNQPLPGDSPAAFKSYRVVRDLTMAMQGLFVDSQGRVRQLMLDLSRREMTQAEAEAEAALHEETGFMGEHIKSVSTVNARHLTKALKAMWIRDGILKEGQDIPGGIAQMTKAMGGFFKEFAVMTEQGLAAQRKIMIERLSMADVDLTRDQIVELVEKTTKFEQRDLYFPKMMFERLTQNQAIIAQLDGQRVSALQEFLSMGERANSELKLQRESFLQNTLSRTVDASPLEYSMDMIGTTVKYADQVIDFWRNNKMGAVAAGHVAKLIEAAAATNQTPAERKMVQQYAIGVSDYLEGWRDLSRGTNHGGIWDNLLSAALSTKVFITMGLNPSSPVQNALEGHAMLALARLHGGSGSVDDVGKGIIDDILAKEHSDMFVQDVYLGQHDGRSARQVAGDRIRTIFSIFGKNKTTRAWAEVERETARQVSITEGIRKATGGLAQITGEMATTGLFMMGGVENHLRSHAMRLGASQEYQFIAKNYYQYFDAVANNSAVPVPKGWFEKYGITKYDIKRDLSGSWKKFAAQRVRHAGYDMVFRTQFNYNAMNRASWERGGVRKLMTMYQHYPASFMMGAIKSMRYQKAGLQAAGAGGLLRRSSYSNSRPMYQNYGLAYMASLVGAVGLTELMKELAGVDATLFSLPVVEISKDMAKWANNHDAENFSVRDVFFGKGALQQVTGPGAVDLVNVLNILAIHSKMKTGQGPTEAQELLRVLTGLTNDGDTFNEGMGYDAANIDRGLLEDLVRYGEKTSVGNFNAGRKMSILMEALQGERDGKDVLASWTGLRTKYEKDYETGEEAYNLAPPPDEFSGGR